MFHRRLLLLMAAFVALSGLLMGQLYRLTVVQGELHREDAEKVLSARRLVDTIRGRILDRRGRVLAEDRPCYDILVDYDVINGQWSYSKARAVALRDHRRTWPEMRFEEREALIAQYREPFDRQVDELWDLLCSRGDTDRATIDERKADIIARVQMIRADVWARRARERAQQGESTALRDVAITIAEEREMHVIVPDASDELAYAVRQMKGTLPPVRVEPSRTRTYADQRVAVDLDMSGRPVELGQAGTMRVEVANVIGHLVGGMRNVQRGDLDERNGGRPFRRADGAIDAGGYLPGDRIGSRGVEAAAETLLRGQRGQLVTRRDTQEQQRQAPVPGGDVQVTIDFDLQAKIAAVMDPSFELMKVQAWHRNKDTAEGTPLYGAAVVVDVDSGEILSMVSTPTVDPARPYRELLLDPDNPLFNKPISAVYPPGSTIKPLVYATAAANRSVGFDQVIDCKGHFLDHNTSVYRCWIYRPDEGKGFTHGPLGPAEAIARSCNIYFYTCGHNLRAELLVAGLRGWGFGEPVGIGLPEESGGIMPSLTGVNVKGRELSLPNAIMMGIGQGPVAVTPLQVAAAHAALARGGYFVAPTLIRQLNEQRAERDLNIPPRVVTNALQGMYDSANADYGTGGEFGLGEGLSERIIDQPGVTIRAKTGTAQASPQYEMRVEGDRLVPDKSRIVRAGTHSWYVAHVQPPGAERARFVVVVLVEYGGSGGRVSGPVTNQILTAMREMGYW
jgi:penicillin-binding protein 2